MWSHEFVPVFISLAGSILGLSGLFFKSTRPLEGRSNGHRLPYFALALFALAFMIFPDLILDPSIFPSLEGGGVGWKANGVGRVFSAALFLLLAVFIPFARTHEAIGFAFLGTGCGFLATGAVQPLVQWVYFLAGWAALRILFLAEERSTSTLQTTKIETRVTLIGFMALVLSLLFEGQLSKSGGLFGQGLCLLGLLALANLYPFSKIRNELLRVRTIGTFWLLNAFSFLFAVFWLWKREVFQSGDETFLMALKGVCALSALGSAVLAVQAAPLSDRLGSLLSSSFAIWVSVLSQVGPTAFGVAIFGLLGLFVSGFGLLYFYDRLRQFVLSDSLDRWEGVFHSRREDAFWFILFLAALVGLPPSPVFFGLLYFLNLIIKNGSFELVPPLLITWTLWVACFGKIAYTLRQAEQPLDRISVGRKTLSWFLVGLVPLVLLSLFGEKVVELVARQASVTQQTSASLNK
jgi:hypothetical protein